VYTYCCVLFFTVYVDISIDEIRLKTNNVTELTNFYIYSICYMNSKKSGQGTISTICDVWCGDVSVGQGKITEPLFIFSTNPSHYTFHFIHNLRVMMHNRMINDDFDTFHMIFHIILKMHQHII